MEPYWDWLTTKSVTREVDISLTILFTIWFTIIKKFVYNKADNGGEAHMGEQATVNRKEGGSIPPSPANLKFKEVNLYG